MNDELYIQLQVMARFLEAQIKQRLIQTGHKASGALEKSIEAVVKRGSDMYVIEGSMAKQGEFVIRGRQAGLKGVPIDALVKWIENKGFTDSAKSTRGIAFAIQTNIKKKGIKPDDFIGHVFDVNKANIDQQLSRAAEKALDLELTNLINRAKQFA